jgi:hypothetical protein
MYRWEEVCPARIPHDLIGNVATLSSYPFISGHLSLRPPTLLGAWPATLTVVRDPARQLMSTYEHCRADADHLFHEVSVNSTFAEWLQSTETWVVSDNPQARYLTDLLGQRVIDPDELFERALDTLDHCFWYTTTEQLDASLARLSEAIGWPVPDRLLRANVTPERRELSDDERELVALRGGVDSRIHEHVAAKVAALPPPAHDQRFERMLEQAAAPLERAAVVDIGMPFWGEGWWPPEPGPAGRFVRWTSLHEPASIDLPVGLRAGDRIEVHVTDTADARLVTGMVLETNGTRAELLAVAPSLATVGAYFVVSKDAGPWTRLTLRSPREVASTLPGRHPKWPEGHAFAVDRVMLFPQ